MTGMGAALGLSLALTCAAATEAGGQTAFREVVPGQSVRQEVERRLGQPVREVSATLVEYAGGTELDRIFVQYRRDSVVVERVEAVYPSGQDRAQVLVSLSLGSGPSHQQVNSRGRFEEYFAPAAIVLTYAGADSLGAVTRVGYYSRGLFDSAVASVPAAPANDGPRRPAPESVPPPAAGRSGTAAARREGGDMRITGDPGGVFEPATRGGTRPDGSGAARTALVQGTYDFTQGPPAPFSEARIELSDGTLYWIVEGRRTALTPASGDGSSAVDTGPDNLGIFYFALQGRPGVLLQFLAEDGRVVQVIYSDTALGDDGAYLGLPKR